MDVIGIDGDIGDTLTSVFTKYYAKPKTMAEASAAGYSPVDGTCDPALGIAYTVGGTLSKATPEHIYFTEDGLLAGVGVDVYGSVKPSLVAQGYFIKKASNRYHISVTFREAGLLCISGGSAPVVIGDRLIVNAGALALAMPVTEQGAIASNFSRGSCFDGMGWHYFKDISGASTQEKMNFPLAAENLLPVVLMFHNGALNAIFFASTDVQQQMFPPRTNGWEPIPLPNPLMCGNWCDEDCGFQGTYIWSTQHWYFHDYTTVKCPATASCKTSGLICCEK